MSDWPMDYHALWEKEQMASKQLRDQLAASQQREQELAAHVEQLRNFIKHAQVSSGVCCCGDGMEGHPSPMACGHSPVDMWDYHSAQLLEAVPDDLSALRAHDAELLAPYQWQPIETAPTNGTRILLLGNGGKIADGHYGQPDGWANPKRFVWPYIHANPTHWMPLPSGDAIKKGGK